MKRTKLPGLVLSSAGDKDGCPQGWQVRLDQVPRALRDLATQDRRWSEASPMSVGRDVRIHLLAAARSLDAALHAARGLDPDRPILQRCELGHGFHGRPGARCPRCFGSTLATSD